MEKERERVIRERENQREKVRESRGKENQLA